MCNKCNNDTCKCDRKKEVDWYSKLLYKNNKDFLVQVIGRDYRNKNATIVKMWHPNTPNQVYFGTFNIYGQSIMSESTYDRIENVPEEPYDTIIVTRNARDGIKLDREGPCHPNYPNVYKRSVAEQIARTYSTGTTHYLVTVDPIKD